MIGAEREHKVTVWNETCRVTTYHKHKTVWIAVGTYKGERIETDDSSEGTALKRWKEAAAYRGG
ncbi:hypothetical protein [Bradyrhizobium sp. CCBAU 51627]|uniref:hypothetical protein n=1 Tax=Bradyrhizobium sp. CCBAU 51627 TaxID=1325088 RepID=UPI002305EC0A|nr:hypothetical protein [Bradyrhizobium sp. CCBAU 51627]MDA9437261.1 hypothetical protein [Bradyrhizobium sp. CCBAU 51627]